MVKDTFVIVALLMAVCSVFAGLWYALPTWGLVLYVAGLGAVGGLLWRNGR